jgi:hypothetical protein
MGTLIHNLLKILKKDLIKQNDNNEFIIDEGKFSDTSLFRNTFVSSNLKPKDASTEGLLLTTDDTAILYSNLVLQAVYTMAQYASLGYQSAYRWNYKKIRAALDFLDSDAWVFKIIDHKTYNLGLTVSTFLKEFLKEEYTKELSNASITNQLKIMQQKLENRLSNYKAHQSKQIEETLQCYTNYETRCQLLQDYEQKYMTACTNLSDATNLYKEQQPLTTDIDESTQSILNLENLTKDYDGETQSFLDFCNTWDTDNINAHLATSIKISPYILACFKQDETDKINQWKILYNTSDSLVTELDVCEQLNKILTDAKQKHSETKKLFLNKVSLLKTAFTNRINDAKVLKTTTELFNNTLNKFPKLELPELITPLLEQKTPWATSFVAYHLLIINLMKLKKERELYLLQPSALPIPEDEILEKQHVSVFQDLQQKTNKPLQEHIIHAKNQLTSIKQMIEQASIQQKKLEENEAKNNKLTCDNKIKELGDEIIKTQEDVNSFKETVEKEHSAWSEWGSQNKYITQHTKTLLEIKEQVTTLEIKKNERNEFLNEALISLKKYKECLVDNKNSVRESVIGEELLIKFLESDKNLSGTIELLYKNVKGWFSFGAVTVDLSVIAYHIDNKIKLIEEEQKSDSEKVTEYKILNKENLWTMRTKLDELDKKKQQYTDLKNKAEENIKLHGEEEQLKSRFNWAAFKQGLNLLDNKLAVQEHDIYDLNNHVKRIEDEVQRLDYMAEILSNITDPKEALTVIYNNQKLLNLSLETMMQEKTEYGQKVAQQSLEMINSDLLQREKELKELQDKFKLLKYEGLEERIKTLEEKLLKLQEQQKKSVDSVSQLTQSLPTSIKRVYEMREQFLSDLSKQTQKKNIKIEFPFFNKHYKYDNRHTDDIKEKYETHQNIFINDGHYEFTSRLTKGMPTKGKIEFRNQIKLFFNELDDVPIDTKTTLKAVKEIDDGVLKQINDRNIKQGALEVLYHNYFGDENTLTLGAMQKYLERRAKEYWVIDLFRNVAAVFLNVFGYQTDTFARTEYVNQLQKTFLAYKDDDAEDPDSTLLLKKLEQGIIQFPPRVSSSNTEVYKLSLQSRLKGLKVSLEHCINQEKVAKEDKKM